MFRADASLHEEAFLWLHALIGRVRHKALLHIGSHKNMKVKWARSMYSILAACLLLGLENSLSPGPDCFDSLTTSELGLIQVCCMTKAVWMLIRFCHGFDFLLAPWARPLLSDAPDFTEEDDCPVEAGSSAGLHERIADLFAQGRLNCVAPC